MSGTAILAMHPLGPVSCGLRLWFIQLILAHPADIQLDWDLGSLEARKNSLGRHCDRQAILSCFCSMGSKCQSKSQDPRF